MTVLQDLRVLVVENDEMSAALLQMQLVHAGATVVGLAASVAEALRMLEDSAPDVALLDYRRPAMRPASQWRQHCRRAAYHSCSPPECWLSSCPSRCWPEYCWSSRICRRI